MYEAVTSSSQKKNITQSTLDSLVNSNGCTALHLSIRHKDQNISTYLLNRGVDYTIQNIQGKSPLHLAFEQNMEYFVDLMLNNHKKYDKNPTDKDGFSHFHIACAKNNIHTVEHLLKLGADVNAPVSLSALFCPGFTPLHFAAKFGSKRVAENLLKHGANFSANDASNLSPFDVAFREANSSKIDGTFDIIKLILTTNNKRKDNSFNDRGFTLVHLASVTYENFQSPLKELNRVLEEFPKYVNKAVDTMNCSWDGFTPLHFAVQDYENESHVKVLIDNGADVLKQASNGDTPLHLLDAWTAHYFLFFMNFQNLRLLELNYIGSQGRSIFHQACYMGNFRLIKFFLEHGIDANDPSIAYGLGCYSDTPLHLAVSNASEWSIENVKLLLDYKADPTTRNHEGNTPLHLMSDNPFPEIIDMLVNQGANINARNALCETPLLTFCRKTKLKFEYLNKIVESFLKKGADINLADRVNETPLTVFSLKKRISPECHSAVKSLMAHVSKLLSADLFVSKINTNAHSSFINSRAFEVPVYDEYFKELEVMKHVYIDNHTTLYGVLRQSPNKLMRTSRNEKFQEILKSHDFSKKFPNYYQILTMRFNQGRLRQPLLEQSLANLEALLKVLPKLCIYEILENLENADLENIIKTIER
ncbi:hypothetical protein QAD02_004489 [Eretmocerus hayati]|uniref:Uncharacterized protein n=1 Tax=Eretmocerus hayati TaxID=131215 RepID=A0ACC2NSM2_9HYME|nr:hypothetical protein QAD02_004489 [Eretmocerus hayati]